MLRRDQAAKRLVRRAKFDLSVMSAIRYIHRTPLVRVAALLATPFHEA